MPSRAKYFSLALLVLVSLVFAGCQKKSVSLESVNTGVPETGLVIDVSGRNNGTATTTPGDVLYLKLSGKTGLRAQWNIVAPVSGDFMSLKNQQVTGLNQSNATTTFEWWFKIENKGTTQLQLDYQQLKPKKMINNFKLSIISQ